jgi:signal recognition particle subunit SRP54
MFDNLSNRFDGIFKRIRGKGRLTEADVDEVLKEIRTALLEADVNVSVVRNVVARIREGAIGIESSKALDPSQQVIKLVNQELTNILGGETLKITYASRPPTVVLMAGLQGSGKTTNSAKLAKWFKSQGRHPLLVGADLQRPAAVEQLRTLGRQIDVPVFSDPSDPVTTAVRGLAEARRLGKDVLIVDTAGRLSIDDEMMAQIREISDQITPNYTFLVIDAMTGQDAVNVAEAFHNTLQIDGVILSKLDGDARGGAALSVKEVIGRPIAFASTGEKLDAFEQFHPDRMAGRILGMGDMLTLIEQAEQAFEKDAAEEAAAKLLDGDFTLDDFLEQMQSLKKMGPLGGLMGMMPGMPKELKNAKIGDDELKPTHRDWQWPLNRRGEPAGQAVWRDAKDDEAHGWHDHWQKGQAQDVIDGWSWWSGCGGLAWSGRWLWRCSRWWSARRRFPRLSAVTLSATSQDLPRGVGEGVLSG